VPNPHYERMAFDAKRLIDRRELLTTVRRGAA
jgi:hypothetical protein